MNYKATIKASTVNQMKKKTFVYIVTDGASRGNPGPAAIGFGIYDKEWNVIVENAKYIGEATNNEAEYKALIWGLQVASTYCKGEIKHLTDSQLLVKQLLGEYAVRAQNLQPLVKKVRKREKAFNSYTHEHVPRQNKHIQDIDQLINNVLDEKGF